jgi:hypothetical protein
MCRTFDRFQELPYVVIAQTCRELRLSCSHAKRLFSPWFGAGQPKSEEVVNSSLKRKTRLSHLFL